MNRRTIPFFLVIVLMAAGTVIAQEQKFTISGVSYTKWLWGTDRGHGAMYNFTSIPGEGYGDNGQGTELELLVGGKPNKYIEVSGRIHSRFNQNFWTNFGGFGGRNPAFENNPPPCTSGDCGENDARSNQYVKLRGLTMRITPSWKLVDSVTIGASDFGMFDPFTIGKIRYIDRDNGAGILVQGSAENFSYDAVRISLPRLWAGPNYTTGDYHQQDSAYGVQLKYTVSPMFDVVGIANLVRDIEVDGRDNNWDDGRDVRNRFRNDVFGVRFGVHPTPMVDIRGSYYASSAESEPIAGAPANYFAISGFGPVPAGDLDDPALKLNVDIVDPFKVGLSFNVEYFDIGAQYVSMMAARRESDVLITEGHDGTFSHPGPGNAGYGVFAGNPTKIGYAGWQGNAQQVATINVDNEFTDFDEPMAESVIGWKGFTVVPTWSRGPLDLAAELTFIDYNTNWQAWDDTSRAIDSSIYPNMESDAGIGHYRNAYAPFQERETSIGVLRGKYTADIGKGVDFFAKFKMIDETDDRLNDARFLPYASGDCPGNGVACSGNKRFYSGENSTAAIYGNPSVITVNGVTGYQWKPFDSISDDDRDMDYKMIQLGAGYQLTDILYGSLAFERYDVDLQDGNTAFQAYQLHEMASGQHEKSKIIALLKFPIGGAEAGFNYEYAFGTFEPDFGGGFVPQVATETIAAEHHVPVGSLGFSGRFGGWNSLEKRDFDHNHLKAYLKIRF